MPEPRTVTCETCGEDFTFTPSSKGGRPRRNCPACVPGGPYDPVLCGCNRDYLTVPLEEAHVCPNPIDPRTLDTVLPSVSQPD